MTLEQWFYALGIVFIVVWLAIVIAIIISAWVIYNKTKTWKKEVTQKIFLSSVTSALLSRNKLRWLGILVTFLPIVKQLIVKHKRR